MNKQRRNDLKLAISSLYDAMSVLDNVMVEEENAYDSLPESIQYSEKGEKMYDNVENMKEIYDTLLDYTTILEEM